MQTRFIERASSLCMAFVLTLAMLGGIDSLSQPEAANAAAQWAQQHNGSNRG